jgi:hypothetical protein
MAVHRPYPKKQGFRLGIYVCKDAEAALSPRVSLRPLYAERISLGRAGLHGCGKRCHRAGFAEPEISVELLRQ